MSIQQKAKQLAQQYKNDPTQNYIEELGNVYQQRQKSDYYQQYDRQFKDMNWWAQQSQSADINQGRIAREQQGQQNAQAMQQRQWEFGEANSRRPGGSSSEGFGIGAAAPSGYSVNAFGQKSLYDASGVANWRNRQDGVINDQIRLAKGLSDIDKNKQDYFNKTQYTQNVDMMNRQASLDAQKTGQERVFQQQEAARERESRQQLALTQAYSFNPGQYQYWGGRV